MRRFAAVSAIALVALLLAPHAACKRSNGGAKGGAEVQKSCVAGTFYPADASSLRGMVERMLARAPSKRLDGRLIGVIAPHAGYRYSGGIAASAFKLLKGKGFERAVVIAPAHRVAFDGAALSPYGHYRTPLGDIPIDMEAVSRLVKGNPWAKADAKPFDGEHALEVELPFLQVALGEFKLVPIVVGRMDKDRMDEMAQVLEAQFGDASTVFVISSDLSHFHDYETAQDKDSKTIEEICGDTPEGFLLAVGNDVAELCGALPVYIMKRIAQIRGAKLELLSYANSGDTTGGRSRVVGYASIAVVQPEGLGRRQKEELLSLARKTVEAHVRGKKLPPLPQDPALRRDGAAFVTLKKGGMLRGCIGQIIATGPLDRTVQRMAISAASSDPRFPPVRPDELGNIDVEISVLTPPEELKDPLSVRVGTDGLIIEKGMRHGVLLPQVPTEQGWDKMQYLQGICRKAGLSPDAWKRAKLMRFQAIVFGESDPR